MPRIERLRQNTPEWHRWRRQGIGASDAPVIMGETPFKTPRTLWSIKTGCTQEDRGGSGSTARSRTGAVRPSRVRATNRHPGGAAVPGSRTARLDAGVAGRFELRRLHGLGN